MKNLFLFIFLSFYGFLSAVPSTSTISTNAEYHYFASATDTSGNTLIVYTSEYIGPKQIFEGKVVYYYAYNTPNQTLSEAQPILDGSEDPFVSEGNNVYGVCFNQNQEALVLLNTKPLEFTALLFNPSNGSFAKTTTIISNLLVTPNYSSDSSSKLLIKNTIGRNTFLAMYPVQYYNNKSKYSNVISIALDTSGAEISLIPQQIQTPSNHPFETISSLNFDFNTTTGDVTAVWSLGKSFSGGGTGTIAYAFRPYGGNFGSVSTFEVYGKEGLKSPISIASALKKFCKIKFQGGIAPASTGLGSIDIFGLNICFTENDSPWCISYFQSEDGYKNDLLSAVFLNTTPQFNAPAPTTLYSFPKNSITNANSVRSSTNEIFFYWNSIDSIHTNNYYYSFLNLNNTSSFSINPLPTTFTYNPNVFLNTFNGNVFLGFADVDFWFYYSGYVNSSGPFTSFPPISVPGRISYTNINPTSETEASIFILDYKLKLTETKL